jgi:uncharacterized UPF0160 family protein
MLKKLKTLLQRSSGHKQVKVAVHDGKFHADDVFSVAILELYLNQSVEIFRTRDPKILSEMDYTFDVGREYDPKKRRFDHHQENWSEKRKNNIPYASSGLIWKEYGAKVTGSVEVAEKIDEKILQSIDAEDNGIEICKNVFPNLNPYFMSDYIFSFNPGWTEKDVDPLLCFKKAVEEAKDILVREIKKSSDTVLGNKIIKKIYEKTEDKRILVLDDHYSWKKLVATYPEPLFVIVPITVNNTWHVNTVKLAGARFEARLDLPKTWAGKTGEDLAKITGVPDAIFCHNRRFVATAKSKEGAIALAKLALKESLK